MRIKRPTHRILNQMLKLKHICSNSKTPNSRLVSPRTMVKTPPTSSMREYHSNVQIQSPHTQRPTPNVQQALYRFSLTNRHRKERSKESKWSRVGPPPPPASPADAALFFENKTRREEELG